MVEIVPDGKVVEQLAEYFHRNGYLRWPNADRRTATPRSYKKGFEVRLVAESKRELQTIRRLLRAAGFKPGRPFAKNRRWRQPLYGRQAVGRFLAYVGWEPDS